MKGRHLDRAWPTGTARVCPRRLDNRDGGQSTVEVALLLPVVVVLALLLVQVGLVVHQSILVTHTAREVARAEAVVPGGSGGASEVGSRHRLHPDRLDVRIDGPDAAGFVHAHVRYRAVTDVALVGRLLPDVTLEARAAMWAEF